MFLTKLFQPLLRHSNLQFSILGRSLLLRRLFKKTHARWHPNYSTIFVIEDGSVLLHSSGSMEISWTNSFCRQKSSMEHSAACKLQVLTNLYSSVVIIWFLSGSAVSSAMQFPQRGTTALPATRTSLGRQSDKRAPNLRAPQDDPTPSNSLTPFQTARRSLRPIGTQSQQQPTTSEAS